MVAIGLMRKAIFLDRDGVLIKTPKVSNKPIAIKELREIKILKGVRKILKVLKKKYILIMITNQPDVSRKKIKKKEVVKINKYLKSYFDLNDIYVCYHVDKDNCRCRKPKPGMIFKAKKKWNIDIKKSFLIGDRYKDIMAGKKGGCINFFINYNYDEKKPSKKYCFYSKTSYSALKIIFNMTKNEKY